MDEEITNEEFLKLSDEEQEAMLTKKRREVRVMRMDNSAGLVAAVLALGGGGLPGLGGKRTRSYHAPKKPKTQDDFDALEKAKQRRARRNEKRMKCQEPK